MTQWVHRLGDGGSPVFRNFSHNIYGFVVVCISGKWRTAGNDTGYSTLENICIARLFRGNVSSAETRSVTERTPCYVHVDILPVRKTV